MEKADIPFLSATVLSEVIRKKEVSPVEAVEAYLDRIDSLDSKLYAYLTVCRDEALQAAREAEQELARGEHRGPMHGIPVAVKDQVYTAGIRTTGGTPIFNDFVPDEDATVITNLKSAGAILLGKLNMTEFATTGLSHAFDTARNPWNTDRYTGGSSSGSGAATAAFMCASSLGEDTGGSVRFPATLVRAGRAAAHLGPGKPFRRDARRLVHGRYRTNLSDRGRLCYHPSSYSRQRPQRPLHI